MSQQRQPEVTYEIIEHDEVERLWHAFEILSNPDIECLQRRVVVPSDEIGESCRQTDTNIQLDTGKQTADPSRRRT